MSGQGRGQDPDKTTGQERADEVHERNAERAEAREQQPGVEASVPGTEEPNLGDEPRPAHPITDPMPSDEELAQQPEPGQEDVPDEHIMPPEVADADDTVDNKESDQT